MSSFWSTIIGAAAAIVGGLGAALWQTRRADNIARRIRREERREQALLALNSKAQDVYIRVAEIVPKAEALARPLTTQDFLAANQALHELARLYAAEWALVIRDPPIEASVWALSVRADELLGIDAAKQYLKAEPTARAEDFVKDLQELLGLIRTLRDEAIKATMALLGE
jgi:hypothetical protein